MINKKFIYRGISVIAALAIWQVAAIAVSSDMLLASPVQVVTQLGKLIFEPEFISTAVFSFLRISAGFISAFVLGTLTGVTAGRFRAVEYMLWPFVITIKSVPVASFIILCLIWLTFGQLTVFISFLIAFPVIYTNVLQGIKSTDPALREVSVLYKVPWRRQLIYVYIPEIKPFMISASGISVGMAWKAGVAAEVIGVVNGSIGEKLYESKIYFQNADLLAWTVIIILMSVISEKLFSLLLKLIFNRIERI